MKQRFEISGGDGGAYGPAFGPVIAEEIAEIHQPPNEYLLLRLAVPLTLSERTSEYMLISPRYVGDSLKKIRRRHCVVGIFIVHEGKQDEVRANITRDNVDYSAVGDCRPLK